MAAPMENGGRLSANYNVIDRELALSMYSLLCSKGIAVHLRSLIQFHFSQHYKGKIKHLLFIYEFIVLI